MQHDAFGRFLKDGTPYLSPSQVNLVMRCGEAWKGKYLLNDPDTTSEAAVFGSACHDVMEMGFTELQQGIHVSSEELGCMAEQKVLQAALKELNLPEAEASQLEMEAGESVRQLWNWVHETGIEPILVEKSFAHRFDVDGFQVALYGRLDLYAKDAKKRNWVLDWKFPRMSPSKHANGLQAKGGNVYATGSYAYMLEAQGFPVDYLGIIHAVHTSRNVAIKPSQYTYNSSIRDLVESTTLSAMRKVGYGQLYPEFVAADWKCSQKWCSRYAKCVASQLQPVTV